MAFDLPTTLSPSKVSAFKSCALAFRFSVIDRLPQPSSVPAVKGTMVHRALELLFDSPGPARTLELAQQCLDTAAQEMLTDPEYVGLNLGEDDTRRFVVDAGRMVERYFTLEDPRGIEAIDTELMLEADLNGVTVRGIIDRLEEDADGNLVVTDYKTGRTPGPQQEQARLEGVHFYSLLCERALGRRPSAVQLIYLGGTPQVIVARPSEQSIRGVERRLGAVWNAIDRACETEDFRPRRSALCDWCAFKAYCPAFGGDPASTQQALAS